MRTLRHHLFALLVLALVLAGCGPAAPTAMPASPTSEPVATPEQVASAVPTDTPPPTDVPEPTELPALESNVLTGALEGYVEGMDCFPDKVTVDSATGFEVTYHDNYKVVTVPEAWAGADRAYTYVLYQRGTPPPDGFDDATLIAVPVERVISMSTSYLAQLDLLGVVDTLVGVDSVAYASTPSVVARAEAGEIIEVGYGPDVNVEQVIELDPSIVLTYGLGNEWDSHPKLLEAGVTTVLSAEAREADPLARAEWIKFIALFYNREALANEIFSSIAERYQGLINLAADVTERPTVFLNAPWGDTWYMAGGQSYVAHLLRAAGADYLWSEDTSTDALPLDFETVYDRALDAEYWLHPSTWSTLDEALAMDERFADFAAFQSGQVYNNNRRTNPSGGNDYWESGVINPDLLLADLIRIFHPELLPDHDLVYYQKLAPLSQE